MEDGKLIAAFDEAKFLNIANIESALDTFERILRLVLSPKSFKASSELDNEPLPWFDDVLCGERISFVHGDGGTELARCVTSTGRLKALEFLATF
jgi:hypothetical protein